MRVTAVIASVAVARAAEGHGFPMAGPCVPLGFPPAHHSHECPRPLTWALVGRVVLGAEQRCVGNAIALGENTDVGEREQERICRAGGHGKMGWKPLPE